MAKSFFEKLGNSLNLEDSQYDESLEDEILDPESLKGDFDDGAMSDDKEELEEKKPRTTLAVSANKKTKIQRNTERAAAKTTLSKSLQIKPKAESENKTVKPEESDEGQLTIDVYDKGDEIVVQSTIAGVNAADLDINITPDSITIRGKRAQEEVVREKDYYYQELYWGAFSRSVILPTEINPDKANAALKNGVLTIRLPKLTKSQQKKLTVKPE
ncbi:MAG: hypothetical protein A2932_02175 [Candidatus Spechtbacteria bacterium RIFCSPLOWO2_01_FULL_46_10]|uniref:SHSP domain-containing protein n=1 Tax=Candidatus Spechtbacteria bacterium RIFCSPLOWO2_01_FULL_46_10 TaxID=1802163 RepID=A0A1G2HJQ3_9BACT|nr:MAG: hypothetical protein A2932_02175 [Candidatus Spechtbacteria bacterium RIFCSPLOWO2_01_FULL_46_10]